MIKVNKYVDVIFLAILAYLAGVSIYRHYYYDYLLSVNNYAAFILLIAVIVYKFFKPGKGQYLVLILLLLGTFNIINFTIEVFRAKIEYGASDNSVEGLGLNFIVFILLIIYYIINRKFIKKIFEKTDEESIDEEKKHVAFYYEKFVNSDSDSFYTILKNYKHYPSEAQIAINRIKEERKLEI